MSAAMGTDKKRKIRDDVSHSSSDGTVSAAAFESLKRKHDEMEVELLSTKIVLQDTKQKLEVAKKEIEILKSNQDVQEVDEDSDIEEVPANQKGVWYDMFLQLRSYRIVNGNCQVSLSDKVNPKLGKWVSNQRMYYRNVKVGKKGQLISQERIAMLDGLGMNWGKAFPPPLSWEDNFAELEKFKVSTGSCSVPISLTNPTPLGKWVSSQRKEKKRFNKGIDSLLTLEQIGKLEALGFNWKGPRLP